MCMTVSSIPFINCCTTTLLLLKSVVDEPSSAGSLLQWSARCGSQYAVASRCVARTSTSASLGSLAHAESSMITRCFRRISLLDQDLTCLSHSALRSARLGKDPIIWIAAHRTGTKGHATAWISTLSYVHYAVPVASQVPYPNRLSSHRHCSSVKRKSWPERGTPVGVRGRLQRRHDSPTFPVNSGSVGYVRNPCPWHQTSQEAGGLSSPSATSFDFAFLRQFSAMSRGVIHPVKGRQDHGGYSAFDRRASCLFRGTVDQISVQGRYSSHKTYRDIRHRTVLLAPGSRSSS